MNMKKIVATVTVLFLVMGSGLFAQRSGTLTPQAKPSLYTLNLNVNVKGAEIRIDNNAIKGTSIQLPAGQYTVSARAGGYQDFSTTVQLSANQTVNINLSPLAYNLQVNANVKGAQVSISGGGSNLSGQSGQTFALPGGSYQITVSASNFQPFSTNIQLSGNQTVNANLVPSNHNLTVNANVKGAQVSVSSGSGRGTNGSAGQTFSLPGGTYQVTVTAPNFQAFSASVQLSSDQTVNANLVPSNYNLTVNANVKGAQVFVSGSSTKGTSGYAGQSFNLPGGTYQITVSAPNFQQFSTSIQLSNDQTINANLVPSTFNLTVRSNVKGAQVSVRGGEGRPSNGLSGQTFNLPADTYQIRVRAPDYQEFNTSVQLSSDQTINADLVLLTGTLVFDMPKGTALQLFVDGNMIHHGKGNSSVSLTPGQHKVRIELGFLATETTVTIEAGKTLSVAPQLNIITR